MSEYGEYLDRQEDARSSKEILDVEYITSDELRRLHPGSKPLPENNEDAECHNCGCNFNDDWNERRMPSTPSAGETWKYQCPNCGFETFEVGT